MSEWLLRQILVDTNIVGCISLYASVLLRRYHKEKVHEPLFDESPLTRLQASQKLTVYSGAWNVMWYLKCRQSWALSWVALMGREIVPKSDQWMTIVRMYHEEQMGKGVGKQMKRIMSRRKGGSWINGACNHFLDI